MKFLNPKFIKRFQRYSVIACFIIAAFNIFYALAFSSDTYPLFYYTDPDWNYVAGSEVYLEVQQFNRELLVWAILGFLVAITMFIYFAHKRRIYYFTNYITISAWSVYNLAMAIVMLFNIIPAISHFYDLDFEAYEEYATSMGQRYIDTPSMFILGVVLSFVMILASLALCFLMYLKFSARKAEIKQRALESLNMPSIENAGTQQSDLEPEPEIAPEPVIEPQAINEPEPVFEPEIVVDPDVLYKGEEE